MGRDRHAMPGGVEVARVGPSPAGAMVTPIGGALEGALSVIEGRGRRAQRLPERANIAALDPGNRPAAGQLDSNTPDRNRSTAPALARNACRVVTSGPKNAGSAGFSFGGRHTSQSSAPAYQLSPVRGRLLWIKTGAERPQ